jgi:hypothetical protein
MLQQDDLFVKYTEEIRRMFQMGKKRKVKKKVQVDHEKTLMRDLRRIGLWSLISVGVTVVIALIVESIR